MNPNPQSRPHRPAPLDPILDGPPRTTAPPDIFFLDAAPYLLNPADPGPEGSTARDGTAPEGIGPQKAGPDGSAASGTGAFEQAHEHYAPTQGHLLSMIPPLLRFTPSESVVVIAMTALGGAADQPPDPSTPGEPRSGAGAREGELPDAVEPMIITAVMRMDLPPLPPRAQLRRVAGREEFAAVVHQVGESIRFATRLAARDGADAVVVVVVSDQWYHRVAEPGVLEPLYGEFEALAVMGREFRVEARSVLLCPAIGTDEPWCDFHAPDFGGYQPDPQASTLALSQVLAGRSMHRTREALAAELDGDPDGPDADFRDEVAQELALPTAYSGTYAEDSAVLQEIVDLLADEPAVAADPTPALAAWLGGALRRPRVRDGLLGLAETPLHHGAERLWLRLTQVLPAPHRAAAAAMLAFCLYYRGEGMLAGMAVDRALAAQPDHGLGALMDTALRLGVHPDALIELAQVGLVVAEALEVVVPTFAGDDESERGVGENRGGDYDGRAPGAAAG